MREEELIDVNSMLPSIESVFESSIPYVNPLLIQHPFSIREQYGGQFNDANIAPTLSFPSQSFPSHCSTSRKTNPIVEQMQLYFPSLPINMSYQFQKPSASNLWPSNGQFASLSLSCPFSQQIPDDHFAVGSPRQQSESYMGERSFYYSTSDRRCKYQPLTPTQPSGVPMQHCFSTSIPLQNQVTTEHSRMHPLSTEIPPQFPLPPNASAQEWILASAGTYSLPVGTTCRLMLPYPKHPPFPSCAMLSMRNVIVKKECYEDNDECFMQVDQPAPQHSWNEADCFQSSYNGCNDATRGDAYTFDNFEQTFYRNQCKYENNTSHYTQRKRLTSKGPLMSYGYNNNAYRLPTIKEEPMESPPQYNNFLDMIL
uniref:Uncharacterized protein n=1 Tax=Ascaris lumbricoides TaxID=6252 RepID=A0A0M3IAW5_ASCLU